ncbi:MAG: sugar ABC transporter permease [Defluviitaleaceae bacterium]|nr:sugar ABC transporter permease [Defluviitaleaceae bacterium]
MKLTMRGKNAIAGYLFIAPFVLGFLAFMAYPLYQNIRMAFSTVTVDFANDEFSMVWAGLANIQRALLVDNDFTQYLVAELISMGLLVLPVLIFSLFIAVLLNKTFPGRGFVRAVFFLPVILASGVLVGIETNNSLLSLVSEQIQNANTMRSSVTGVIESILVAEFGAGIGEGFIEYILAVVNQIYTIAMASGIQIVIFLAGLQTINPSIYEASSIEGATGWENFWKITFPMISPMILVVVIYSIVDFMNRTDGEIMEMIDIVVNRWREFGFGSAIAMIYFTVIALVLAIVGFLISRLVYYYD